jgi:hypothetical protein
VVAAPPTLWGSSTATVMPTPSISTSSSSGNRRSNRQAAFQMLLGLGTSHAPVPLTVVRGATDFPQFQIRP